MNERPDFNKIESYNEFIKYYWYRDELKKICKSLGIASNGTKQDLNYYIEQYFNGNIIKDNKYRASKVKDSSINLNSKLLECGFCFNQKFREYFSKLTNITNFKFNADMASTWRMVKRIMIKILRYKICLMFIMVKKNMQNMIIHFVNGINS